METFVSGESDLMESVLEMNDLVNSQGEAEHVLIDVYNQQEVALYQVLNKIQDSKQLTRKEIDWIVKHLEMADPENELVLKAE